MNEDKIQIAIHEERIKNLSEDVSAIKTNHLPHIQEAVDELSKKTQESFNSINTKLAYWAGAIAVIVVVAQFIVPLILKSQSGV